MAFIYCAERYCRAPLINLLYIRVLLLIQWSNCFQETVWFTHVIVIISCMCYRCWKKISAFSNQFVWQIIIVKIHLKSTICDYLHCWITYISFLNVFSHLHILRHQICSFKIVILFTKVKKGVQTYLALCEKVTAPKISHKQNLCDTI